MTEGYMKVIGLYGRSNIGKTTTLTMLANEIVKNGLGVITDLTDTNYTLKITDGRTVCITTSGDDVETATSNAEYARKQNPDIWFTAMRTRGGSTNLFEFYENAVYYSKNALSIIENLTEEEILDLQRAINITDMKALYLSFLD